MYHYLLYQISLILSLSLFVFVFFFLGIFRSFYIYRSLSFSFFSLSSSHFLSLNAIKKKHVVIFNNNNYYHHYLYIQKRYS